MPQQPASSLAPAVDGYRGIWFELNQKSQHGDKYSGGLGTYTANHLPMAVHAAKVNKTFFVYGGTTSVDARHLLCMIGEYDHAQHMVGRPRIVHDKQGVDDPHDNPSVNLDAQGRLLVFVSGRGQSRPGYRYRSVRPYDITEFELLETCEMTYPQIHLLPDDRVVLLFTKYTAGRELYWQVSNDGGEHWTADQKLAGMGGHYQVSRLSEAGVIGSSFMFHPDGDVDMRTNLYYAQTADAGQTWTAADGTLLHLPLHEPNGQGLIIDYQSQGVNVYIHDLAFDGAGHPAILYLTSRGAAPGPQHAPHRWRITRWTGQRWQTTDLADSDHNYDTGALYIEGPRWQVIGPMLVGPQRYGTGGEMAIVQSDDDGLTWSKPRAVTAGSAFNHSYARRPLHAADPFFAYWADGDAHAFSPSRLYFADRAGERVWRLPQEMTDDLAPPELVRRAGT